MNHLLIKKGCNICIEEFANTGDKYYHKVRNHVHDTGKYRGATQSICNLRYKIPKEIPAAFQNGSNYDSHFVIKELTEVFKGQLTCHRKYRKIHNHFRTDKKKKLKMKRP